MPLWDLGGGSFDIPSGHASLDGLWLVFARFWRRHRKEWLRSMSPCLPLTPLGVEGEGLSVVNLPQDGRCLDEVFFTIALPQSPGGICSFVDERDSGRTESLEYGYRVELMTLDRVWREFLPPQRHENPVP